MKDNNEVGWALIPPNIISRQDLSANEKLIFGRIMGLLSIKGYCWASNMWLGKQIGLDKNTVANIILSLRQKKLIETHVIRDDNKKIIERQIFVRSFINAGIPIPGIRYTPIPGIMKDSVENISVEYNNNNERTVNGTENDMELNPDLDLLTEKYSKEKKPSINTPNWKPQKKYENKPKKKGVDATNIV